MKKYCIQRPFVQTFMNEELSIQFFNNFMEIKRNTAEILKEILVINRDYLFSTNMPFMFCYFKDC